MPKWLAVVIVLVIVLLFVVPDPPAGAGTVLGNSVTALVTFIRHTIGNIRPAG